VTALHQELKRVLKLPEVEQRLAGLGGEQRDMTIEAFGAFNRAEFERFGKLIAEAKIGDGR